MSRIDYEFDVIRIAQADVESPTGCLKFTCSGDDLQRMGDVLWDINQRLAAGQSYFVARGAHRDCGIGVEMYGDAIRKRDLLQSSDPRRVRLPAKRVDVVPGHHDG